MIIGEEVQLPERGYNVSQAIQVLADKGGYREAIEERASRFAERIRSSSVARWLPVSLCR